MPPESVLLVDPNGELSARPGSLRRTWLAAVLAAALTVGMALSDFLPATPDADAGAERQPLVPNDEPAGGVPLGPDGKAVRG